MLKKLILSALFLGIFTSSAMAKNVDRIAAIVNDDIITTFQLQQRLVKSGGDSTNVAQQKQLLAVMINELLMRQRAQDIGIEVTDKDIEQAMQDVEKKNKIDRSQLQQALVSQGLTLKGYRSQLHDQILRYKLMGHEVQSKVDITRQEIRDYYQQHLDEYRQSAHSKISRVSFPFAIGDAAAEQQAQHNAQIALRKLHEGTSVDGVLEELSGRTQVEGGDMGDFKPGELSSTFEAALAGLDTGGITAIIELGNAFHILKVENKATGGLADLASVKEKISQKLRQKKLDEKLTQWREKLKKEAYIDNRL